MRAGLVLLFITILAAVLVFFVVGGWPGLGYAVTASVLTLLVSAAALRDLYGGNVLAAVIHHLRLMSGLTMGLQIIEDGKTVVPPGAGQLLGPRLLIIKPENAVILESGPRQTRISGPAIFTSGPFEYVKRIYDLRRKQESFTFDKVLTSDLMAATVRISVTYGISVSPAARLGETPFAPADINTIQHIDSWLPNWERTIASAIEGNVRQAVGLWSLENLLEPGNFATLEQRVFDSTNQRIRNWDVEIHRMIVESVQPEREVIAATTSITIERALAAARRDVLRLLADGYQTAKAMGMSDDAIKLETQRETLLARYEPDEQAIIADIMAQLNQAQLDTMQTVLDALEANQVSEAEIRQVLNAVQDVLATLQQQIVSLPGQQIVAEVVGAPTLDVKHKLKLTLPIIPLLLGYEGELELDSGVNLEAVWQRLVTKVVGK